MISHLQRPIVWAVPILSTVIFLGCTNQDEELKYRPVVRVNDVSLSAKEFSDSLATRLRVFNSLSAKDSAVIAQAKSAVIQDFIVSVVTQQWAQQNQIFVRKEDLDAEILKVRKSYPDDFTFRKALADEGLTYETWESRVKNSLLEKMVVHKLLEKLPKPTESELLVYYNKNKSKYERSAALKLRQIVTTTDEDAQKIRTELSKGRSFVDLAKKFSISSDASLGGELGWVEKGTADFYDTLNKLAVGQKSNVIKTPFGFHIFEIMAKRPGGQLSFNEARKGIEQSLLSAKEQDIYSSWLEEQVLKSRVFKDDEFINNIQVQTRGQK